MTCQMPRATVSRMVHTHLQFSLVKRWFQRSPEALRSACDRAFFSDLMRSAIREAIGERSGERSLNMPRKISCDRRVAIGPCDRDRDRAYKISDRGGPTKLVRFNRTNYSDDNWSDLTEPNILMITGAIYLNHKF